MPKSAPLGLDAATHLDQLSAVQKKIAIDSLKTRLTGKVDEEKQLREACEGFESIFIHQLWKQMRATVPKEGYLHSKEEDQYLAMFDQELAKKMAGAGGVGIADMLYDQLKGSLTNASRSTTAEGLEPLPMRPLHQSPAHRAMVPEAAEAAEPTDLYSPLGETPEAPMERKEQTESRTAQDVAQGPAAMAAPPVDTVISGPLPASTEPGREALQEQLRELERRITSRRGAAVGEGGPVPLSRSDTDKRLVTRMKGEMDLDMQWPLEGDISSGFGWRRDPFTGRHAYHAGVDIMANEGSPVRACWPGTVVHAGEKGGYGELVVIEHEGGWQSYYGHNSDVDVRVGDVVAAGREIAKVGSSGRSTGAHLHFELRQGEQAWDPIMIKNRLQNGLHIGAAD